jgi:hypothetical protein
MRRIVFLAAALFLPLSAQYKFFSPESSFTVEVSLDGSPYTRLPIYRNAITSLEVAGDYAVGGTSAASGLSPFLFAVSLSKREVTAIFPLDRALPGQRALQSGFARSPDGWLYAGTMPVNPAEGGHVLRARMSGKDLQAEDLGAPVPGEGIFAIASDSRTGAVYGLSHPSGKFFVFDPKTRKAEVYDQTAPSRQARGQLRSFALQPEDWLSRRLAVDRTGRVYGSQPVNRIFRFDPRTRKIELLSDELPEVWGRRALGRVDAWAMGPDGALYGGNAGDGQLFRLDPDTGRVRNLGKPAMMPRLKGLAFAADGKLYGLAGAPPGYTHLFRYDHVKGFVDLGNPRFEMIARGIEQGIAWRGFHIGTLAASEDGKYIVLGEEEALSQLMVFPVP